MLALNWRREESKKVKRQKISFVLAISFDSRKKFANSGTSTDVKVEWKAVCHNRKNLWKLSSDSLLVVQAATRGAIRVKRENSLKIVTKSLWHKNVSGWKRSKLNSTRKLDQYFPSAVISCKTNNFSFYLERKRLRASLGYIHEIFFYGLISFYTFEMFPTWNGKSTWDSKGANDVARTSQKAEHASDENVVGWCKFYVGLHCHIIYK